jgi:hypothetical protein
VTTSDHRAGVWPPVFSVPPLRMPVRLTVGERVYDLGHVCGDTADDMGADLADLLAAVAGFVRGS